MSRIGKKTIKLTDGVTVTSTTGKVVISGSKGELSLALPKGIDVLVENGEIKVSRQTDDKQAKSLHGSIQRTLVNSIEGVTSGWTKKLELVGTGYRARLEGNSLVLTIGFSHPVKIDPPSGITLSVEENKILVSGIDRHLVGQIAANIKDVRPPDSYKGKGIRYEGEKVRRKPGKAAKVGGAA